MKLNVDIREAAAEAGIWLWQIADALGITDATFSRKLRHEFSDQEKQRVLRVIKELSEGKDCEL